MVLVTVTKNNEGGRTADGGQQVFSGEKPLTSFIISCLAYRVPDDITIRNVTLLFDRTSTFTSSNPPPHGLTNRHIAHRTSAIPTTSAYSASAFLLKQSVVGSLEDYTW